MTDPRPVPLDLAAVPDVVDRVLTAHEHAVALTRAAAREIADAVDLVAGRFAAGGRLLLTATDPTAARVLDFVTADLTHEFGLANGAVTRVEPDALHPTARDAVLVVATDGDAGPAAEAARRRSAGLVLVSTTRTTVQAEVAVALDVETEPVRGLTRLGAATALKAALDALTTAVVAQLGRVHDDLPVDLVATTDAQREQVVAMVGQLADVDEHTARPAAERSGHDVRVAVLGLVADLDPAAASTLAANRRTLRDALTDLPRRPPGSALR